jgi:hypothetical protein
MKTIVSFTVFVCISLAVTAQTNPDSLYKANTDYRRTIRRSYSDRYIVNSEIGDITFFDQGHPDGRQYLLNGNFITHFAVTRKSSAIYIVNSPIIRVRIIANQPSMPIRTPSFEPGTTLFFNPFGHDPDNYKYFSIGIFHHSNGQDGDALNPDRSVNLRNGNFTTNFVTLNFYKGRYGIKVNSFYKVGLEIHSGLIKFADEKKLRSRFGMFRFNGQCAFSIYQNKISPSGIATKTGIISRPLKERFLADGMIVLNKIEAKWNQHFNLEFKFYYNPFDFENTSFFASLGYMGHDNYNIYFVEPYPFVRIGLAAGLPLKPALIRK